MEVAIAYNHLSAYSLSIFRCKDNNKQANKQSDGVKFS